MKIYNKLTKPANITTVVSNAFVLMSEVGEDIDFTNIIAINFAQEFNILKEYLTTTLEVHNALEIIFDIIQDEPYIADLYNEYKYKSTVAEFSTIISKELFINLLKMVRQNNGKKIRDGVFLGWQNDTAFFDFI